MTIEKIKIPDLGEAVDVEVIEICVQPGDTVSKDDSIIVLESEKAAMANSSICCWKNSRYKSK